MKIFNLSHMIRGWFAGDFSPTAFQTKDFEVGIKHYKAGDFEKAHHHKLATEITVIISGQVKMNGITYSTNDIIVIEPNETTDFECLTDVVTCVVKSGSFSNDKYLAE